MSNDLKGYVNPQLLITTSALGDRLAAGSEAPVVLDLRPAELFAVGHIPGAVHLDLFGVSLIDTDPAPLAAFLWMIGHLLASRGVDPERTVVVYDEKSGMRAARAFWLLEYFGHPDVSQLDGGFGAWEREGRHVSRDAVTPKSSDWAVGRSDERLATWRDLRDRLDAADVAVLDTRTDGEYCGTTVRAKRGGRHPGRGPHRVDTQPRRRRRLQAGGRAETDIRERWGHPGQGSDQLLSGRLPRGAQLPGAAAAWLYPCSQLHRFLEGVGGPGGPADRDPEPTLASLRASCRQTLRALVGEHEESRAPASRLLEKTLPLSGRGSG